VVVVVVVVVAAASCGTTSLLGDANSINGSGDGARPAVNMSIGCEDDEEEENENDAILVGFFSFFLASFRNLFRIDRFSRETDWLARADC
jgi:hypothetical protein